MANVDSPFGMRPSSKVDGSDLDYGLQTVAIPASDASDYFINQPVRLAGSSQGNYPTVTATTPAANEDIDYVIVGFEPDFQNESFLTIYGVASTDRIARAIPVMNVVFEIQVDGSITAGSVGGVGLITTEVGNTVSGNSTVELNSGSISVGGGSAANQLLVVGISEDPNNQDLSVANPNVYVVVNHSRFANAQEGI